MPIATPLVSPGPADIAYAVSDILNIMAIAVILIIAISILVMMRRSRKLQMASNDTNKLRYVFEQLEAGDFYGPDLHLEGRDFQSVQLAYERMIPNLRTTIENLEWAAQHDALTSLLNPASFKRKCQAMLNDQDGKSSEGALLFFDINDFKKINDSLGHEAGDRFLAICADRIRMAASTFKSGKLAALAAGESIEGFEPAVGRLGGDEFGVFIPGELDQEEIERFIFRLKRLIAEPCQIGAHALHAKISIGAAFSADHHNSYEKLLAAADTAMYEAKSHEPGGHRFYNANMRNQADRILEQELEFRNALNSQQFRLYFQPQLDLTSNTIRSAEALIRWHHPTRGVIMPSDFIPFAETYDLIDDIGDWVVHEAIRTAANWWRQGHQIRLAINVSPKQLNRIELIPYIRACLQRYQLPAKAIEIEITEAAIMRSDDVPLERLQGLRRDGVTIALDDFGTGYSNLAQLFALPMDILKLDRSILELATTNLRRRQVLLAIIELSKKLGFSIVAEGVETERQLEILRDAKCHYAQGYLISHPVSEADFLKLVDQYNAPALTAVQ